MALHLIIKGNVAQATQAAHDHGISLNQIRTSSNCSETNARCASDYHARAVSWFAEAPTHAPFPAGTLLLFTEGLES